MQIIEKNIDELVEYENNPRNNDEAVKFVAASIKEFGFKVPIVIDKDNVIVCGHTRVKAARELGTEGIPCIVADDLTEDQIKAFRLADNKVSEVSGWDFSKLEAELSLLDLSDIDMTDFGFEPTEGGDLTDLFEDTQSDTTEKPPKTAICPHCGKEFEL